MNLGDIQIIKATTHHYEDYFSVRSEPKNVFWTGYESAPDYEDFKKWYDARVHDEDRCIYLLFVNKDCAGALNIDFYNDYAAIGYSVKESFEGKGLASKLVQCSQEIILEEKRERTGIKTIKAWIAVDNLASTKVIKKNGFSKSEKEVRFRHGKEVAFQAYALDI